MFGLSFSQTKCLAIVWPNNDQTNFCLGNFWPMFGHVWSSVYNSKYGSKCYFSHKYEKKAEKIEGEDKEAIK